VKRMRLDRVELDIMYQWSNGVIDAWVLVDGCDDVVSFYVVREGDLERAALDAMRVYRRKQHEQAEAGEDRSPPSPEPPDHC